MNKKQKKLISIFLIGAAVLSMLAGCGKKAENEPEQIRVMTPGNYLPIIIADKKGFFKEAFGENVNVEVTAADSGSAIMETMTSGGVEFAALGDMPVVQAKAKRTGRKSDLKSVPFHERLSADRSKRFRNKEYFGYQGKTGRGDVGKHQS